VLPVKYELGFYIPEDDILHSHCRENLKSYTGFRLLTGFIALARSQRQVTIPVGRAVAQAVRDGNLKHDLENTKQRQ
jgi:hypothetical protein